MKPDELISMLKASVEKWNSWKEENASYTPDFSAADLTKARLRGINFRKAFLPRAVFMEAYLREANFEGANLERTLFRMADLGSAKLRGANMYKSNLRRADLWRADLSAANLKAADLGKASLQEANLDSANLEKASLQGADLRGASLTGANLRGANLQGAHVAQANFRDAVLDEAIYDRNAIKVIPRQESLPARENPAVKEGPLQQEETPCQEETPPRRKDAPPLPESLAADSERDKETPGKGMPAPVNTPPAQQDMKKKDYPPGSVFGTYEIKEKLAQGGMGVIYLAFDRSLERDVAIKILSGELRDTPEYLQRFLQEARITAQMDHPNIINIFTIAEEQNEVFVAMQLIKGRNIAQILREKKYFEIAEALMITRDVASALAYAHERGLIHRDIKPDNIMIDEQKRVKVMDFGIARDLSTKKRITREGHFMGTIHYSAPEQWSNDVPDRRSDIYSLGVVLYEMLTGRLPFEADSPMNLLYKITREQAPPVSNLCPHIPPEAEKVLHRMMSKDLERRYSHAGQVVADIDRILETFPPVMKQDTMLHITDFEKLLHDESPCHIETPKSIVMALEELQFATRGKKKFLKLLGDEVYARRLGSGCLYALFRETVRNALEGGKAGSRFPLLSGARKGRTVTEEEVVQLKTETEQVEKQMETLPLSDIWTLSFDMNTKETFSKKMSVDELEKVCAQCMPCKSAPAFSNCREFFSSITQAYREVCEKAMENKTGAFWAETKSRKELP